MTTWKCTKCGNTIAQDIPPDACTFCKEKCKFIDVTCYIPECGGPASGNINQQVFTQSTDPDNS